MVQFSSTKYPRIDVTGLSETQEAIFQKMLKLGVPMHYQAWAQFLGMPESTVYKNLRLLAMFDVIRRVSPGVYSAFGSERD